MWLEAQNNSSTIQYLDTCQGPHCNSDCPDQVILGRLSPYWSTSVQWIILAVTATVTIVCVATKLVQLLNYKHMKMIQRKVVEECAVQPCGEMESAVSLVCTYFHFFIYFLTGSFPMQGVLCVCDRMHLINTFSLKHKLVLHF